MSYGDHGNWVIGAPDVLLDPESAAAEQAERIGAQGSAGAAAGLRGSARSTRPDAPGDVTPVALVVLEQKVRPDARETLEYFAAQQVSVKVISGDNAVSVGAVADKLGLHGETMDARRAADRPRPNWPTRWTHTPRSAGCGPIRNAPWCTPCNHAATPWR